MAYLKSEKGRVTAKELDSPTFITPALGTPASGVMTNMTGAVEASLVDNAVTLAKMAGGTDGNIISYDASGDPVAIATGSDGQVLTSTGAGSPPAFEDAAGGGGVDTAGSPADFTIAVFQDADTIQGNTGLKYHNDYTFQNVPGAIGDYQLGSTDTSRWSWFTNGPMYMYDIVNTNYALRLTASDTANAFTCEGTITASTEIGDYAEYFESVDGTAIAVGSTVTLVEDKIRVCGSDEIPIGVIRAPRTSTVVGGTQTFHWGGKYLRDEYDAMIFETLSYYSWTGDDGQPMQFWEDEQPEGVTIPDDAHVSELRRPKVNPDYDSDIFYDDVARAEGDDNPKRYRDREERDEWNIVGLMGQVKITKGQVTASTWVKMKDTSETVESWFIK